MSRLEQAVERLRSGGVAILADEDRAGEGDLVAAGDMAEPETVRTLAQADEGRLCLIFDSQIGRHLDMADEDHEGRAALLAAMAAGETEAPPDMAERVRVIREAAAGALSSAELDCSGIVALRAATGGVLGRAARPEAAVDALRLAGRAPVAVISNVRLPGGVLAGEHELDAFAAHRGFPVFTVQDVVAHRLARETIVEAAASARLPSIYADGLLDVQAFRSLLDGSEHLALIHGPLGEEPLVRVHSECLTGDALGSLRCDCGDQLRRSLELIAEDPAGGVVVYLRGQEGRGIGLVNKIRAYALQDLGRDTVEANVELGFPADLRDYGIAVQILRSLEIRRLRLLSNNPRKSTALERYGIAVAERVPLRVGANPHNADYLETKRLKMGHDLGSARPSTRPRRPRANASRI